MSFGSTQIDPGTTPSVPVAHDLISGAVFQRVKLVDGTEGDATPVGIAANPLTVRPRRRGSADYDSGRVAVVSGAPAAIVAATIYPEGATVANPTSGVLRLTLQTDAGDTLMIVDVAPFSVLELPVPRAGAWAGLRAGGSGAGLVLQVAGGQS